ncbi:carbamoyltransferase C-terminal domain-containing protein [Thalassobaculum sp.]|uniref:carbamoyltransferase C-terminal domain-containing protein n=1 Tax=Thalassobaculum sp. TaxID=2022740 RepID=UPI0032EABAB2
MIVIGLNFAHDAGVSVVDNGRTVAVLQRERFSRTKRSALLTAEFVEFALRSAGIEWRDVDTVAVSTSQSWPFIFLQPSEFRVAVDLATAERFGFSGSMLDAMRAGERWIRSMDGNARARVPGFFHPGGAYTEYLTEPTLGLDLDASVFANVDWPYQAAWWRGTVQRGDLAGWCGQVSKLRSVRQGYMPATATLRGVSKPALLVPHHLAHAANAFYQSDLERAAIYTIDNGEGNSRSRGYLGGIYAYGEGERLIPIGPTYASHGHLYQRVGERLRLGHSSAAGKLMGLAPYGQPRFFDRALIGNAFELFGSDYALGDKRERGAVLKPLEAIVGRRSPGLYDDPSAPTRHSIPGEMGADNLGSLDVDLAATAQALFEENMLGELRGFADGLHAAGLAAGTICLGGGGALNCPTNSRLWREGPFRSVFVPPCCDDSGLPLGAALAVSHDVLGVPRQSQAAGRSEGAYLGLAYDEAAVTRAIDAAGAALVVERCSDPARAAAEDLSADRIVSWFEGRSEIGPRALGHRSILADPRGPGTWRRVNHVKRREYWRPFAPAVLQEKAGEWFEGAPAVSPFMLFTARVRGDGLPAITHVDGSARIQTVDASSGGFRKVIEAFDALTGVPVVLNTSFNGPGEPIVETPEEALAFLLSSEVDAVYLEGFRISRREATDA